MLNTGLFTDQGDAVPAGMVVVGAALEPGAVPTSGLRAGDAVNVLAAQRTTATGQAEAAAPPVGDVARDGDGVVGRGDRVELVVEHVGLARRAGGVAGSGRAGRGRRAAAAEPGGWRMIVTVGSIRGAPGATVVGIAARRGMASRSSPNGEWCSRPTRPVA